MHITRLHIFAFRNHIDRVLDIPVGASVIGLIGPNGSGKTNILECLSLLGPTRGLRGVEPRSHLSIGHQLTAQKNWGFHVELTTGQTIGQEYAAGNHGGSRKVLLDGQPTSLEHLGTTFSTVWLTPQSDFLFIGPADQRRHWFDDVISAFNPSHAEAVARFQRHRRTRLKILTQYDEGDWLDVEEAHVAQWGIAVLRGRCTYLNALAPYLDNLTLHLYGKALDILDDTDPILSLRGKLRRSRDIDRRLGRTHAGPNTLDLRGVLRIEAREPIPLLQASSGQHKRALLDWLQAHVRLLNSRRGLPPLVLIDEFTAHLDQARRTLLLQDLIRLGCQVWLADTELAAQDGLWIYQL
jgi:DNA replication and repair protein RecF